MMWAAASAKFAQLVGLLLLAGLPAFWFGVWQPSAPPGTGRAGRLLGPAFVGGAVIIIALAADLIRILGPLLAGMDPSGQLALVLSFMRNTEVGRWFAVRPMAVAGYLVFLIISVRVADQEGGDGSLPGLLKGTLASWALLVVASISMAGHAAVNIGPALGGLIDGVHVVATVLWAGSLLGMAVVPWFQEAEPGRGESEAGEALPRRAGEGRATDFEAGSPGGARRVLQVLERVSRIGLLAVLVLSASGFVLAAAHVFSPAVAAGSVYGRSLVLKLILFAGLVAIAAMNRFRHVPALRRAVGAAKDREALQPHATGSVGLGSAVPSVLWKLRRSVRAEAALVIGVLAATGMLTQVWPPSTPGMLTDTNRWEQRLGPWDVAFTLSPGPNATVRMELAVAEAESGRPVVLDGIRLGMDMETHVMGVVPPKLVMTEPGVYEASTYLIMPGRWQIDVALRKGEQEQAFSVFADARDVPLTDRAPLQIVLKGRFLGPLGLAFALLVAGAGVWIVVHWAPVFRENGGMAAVASGVLFFLGGVFWIVHLAVNPTMYMANPVQASPSVAEQARPLYEAHCASCHGETGRGDGPQAAGLRPPPADFVVHVGHHREGEFFWIITHGRRGTAMPAFQSVLTEEERWLLTRYVRELGFAGREAARESRSTPDP